MFQRSGLFGHKNIVGPGRGIRKEDKTTPHSPPGQNEKTKRWGGVSARKKKSSFLHGISIPPCQGLGNCSAVSKKKNRVPSVRDAGFCLV